MISNKSSLGAYYRRLCSRVDKPKAVTATTYKLTRLIHMKLTKGEEYTAQREAYYAERYRERILHHLAKKAEKMVTKLVQNEEANFNLI